MKKPELAHMAPTDLIPYEGNVKKHPPDQVARIATSISRFGFDVPIVVDRNMVVIKGHGRRLAAIELGLDKVPVFIRHDLTTEEANAARLADNRAGISDIDSEMLQTELEKFNNDMLTGIFDSKELSFVQADLGLVNTDAFESDMGALIENQRQEMASLATEATSEERIPVARAFGFKDMPARAAQVLMRFVAAAEQATGLKNGDAVLAHIETQTA